MKKLDCIFTTNMKIVGLTGGIGSGKTTVAKVFETLNVPVYYADDEAKKLYVTNFEMKDEIIQKFGQETYLDGKLNKEFLGKQVFSDKKKLELLNSIVHPKVEEHFQNWLAKQNNKPFVIKEAAILIEAGGAEKCDWIILVTAPIEERIRRVMKRDISSEQQVRNRIDKQMSEEEKKEYADFIIDNSGDKMLLPQIMEIYKKLLRDSD